MLAIAAMTTSFFACDDDEPTPDGPSITAPAVQSVTVNGQVSLDFVVSVPGGYENATATASAGTVTVTQLSAGATEGTVSVQYTASATAGAASVTLIVEDRNGKTETETATVNVSASPVPSISGIPASASVVAGDDLSVSNVVLTSQDGFAASNAFTVSVNGGDAINLSSLITGASPQTVTITYPTTVDMIGTQNLVFTLTDANGDATTLTHVLTITAPEFEKVIVNTNIEANTTWTKDKIYELATRVIVEPGFTLTIEAGTVIKGQAGSGANATALIIAKGAKIMADGTADMPIIFTSTSDNLIPGQIKSPNLVETNTGLWGGLIVLGNAPVSVEDNSGSAIIEGVPADEGLAVYGGNNAADNSGVLRYVSIRHGGTVLGEGSEINGLTLGGVGSGTVVEHIEVVGNFDDGVELFGGTVNITDLLIWAPDDDGLDIDQAYAGTVSNVIVIAQAGTDHNFEFDGPEGALTARFTIENASLKGVDDEIADLRETVTATIRNVYMFNFTKTTDGEGDFALSSGTTVGPDNMVFENLQVTLPAGATIDALFPGMAASVTAVAAGAQTVGADEAEFANWTFASQAGAITGF